MEHTVLLVVDMQNALIQKHPYNELTVLRNIKELQTACRENAIEVIHVRHDDGIGSSLQQGTIGWQIFHLLAPINDEKVFDKHHNSAFKQTRLKQYLDSKKVMTIILVGMQSEYCIDTTCRVAYEYGYHIIIPKDTTTTFFNDYLSGKEASQYFENKIWNHRFADVLPVNQVLSMIRNDK